MAQTPGERRAYFQEYYRRTGGYRQRHPEKARAASRAYEERNKEQRNAANLRRSHARKKHDPEGVLKKAREWARNNPDKVRDAARRRRVNHYLVVRAREQLQWAVRCGRLVRRPCEGCGADENVQGHHDDYSKPLEVRWLCQKCHDAHHREE